MQRDPEATEHYWKALNEQMLIMSQCHGNVDESNLEFIQVHALAIVQLCNQLMDSPLSTASYGANLASG